LLIFLMAQAYGTAPQIDVTGLWTIRRRRPRRPSAADRAGLLYVVVCLLAAAAANVRGPWFYAPCVLAGGRSGRCARTGTRRGFGSRLAPWPRSATAATSGFRAQRVVESKALEDHRVAAPRHRSVPREHVGAIGSLKPDRIVLRLEPMEQGAPPPLLREATYNIYNAATWFAYDAGFAPIAPGQRHVSAPAGPPTRSSRCRPAARGGLALPHGAFALDRLTAAAPVAA
jgi:hypothetical protein